MGRKIVAVGMAMAAGLTLTGVVQAQTTGHWSATSNSAMAITGDINVTPNSIVFGNGATLAIAPIADPSSGLTATDVTGWLGSNPPPPIVYRVVQPRALTLLNGNSICAATYVVMFEGGTPPTLSLAFFTGAAPPTANFGTSLCSTYTYEAGQ